MLLTKNYQNWPMLVETTAFQIWRVSDTQCRMVWLYPTVKRRCVYSFWQNSRTWQTDRQTYTHTAKQSIARQTLPHSDVLRRAGCNLTSLITSAATAYINVVFFSVVCISGVYVCWLLNRWRCNREIRARYGQKLGWWSDVLVSLNAAIRITGTRYNNLARHLVAGCCHLANLTPWCQSCCPSILNVSWW